MDKKIGFIGCGNMGKAMVGGIVKSGLSKPSDILISDRNEINRSFMQKTYGIGVTENNVDVAKHSQILFLAVKPYHYKDVIRQIRTSIADNTVIVAIAAGISINDIELSFDKKIKVVRAMPNTPSLVGEGMCGFCGNNNVTDDELKDIKDIFQSFGKAELVEEKLFSAVGCVSGCSPAFVYMFIEAMADEAVLEGMPRKQAYKFAAQAVLGSAKMVLETGTHPAELKDNVCSPAGITIKGVASLEKSGFRGTIIQAMRQCGDNHQ